MKIYVIGICGTFMGGVARLAVDLGMQVSGSDAHTYPPMSTQLEALGIELHEGYDAANIPNDVDVVVVGNTISRGNPELEHVLEKGMRYTSGAQWLSENVLANRWVLAVAGTHGKTTTSSMLAWLLEDNQLAPGFLIGGVPENFGQSARIGETSFFVIEADEYDTAFSDKRSKFVHYRPRTLIINNLEFDHADIFADLAAIQTQFHHLIKTLPSSAQIISNNHSSEIEPVFEQGVWSEVVKFGNSAETKRSDSSIVAEWQVRKITQDASEFEVLHADETATVNWSLIGDHNMLNALAAIAAAQHVGVRFQDSCRSLSEFKSVKRRLEKIYDQHGVKIYDDFAHHPTAILETLKGLRNNVGNETILAVLEPRSNTMKRGVHKHLLSDALQSANKSLIFADDNVLWDIKSLRSELIEPIQDFDSLIEEIINQINNRDQESALNILIMSNGGFGGLHRRLIEQLEEN